MWFFSQRSGHLFHGQQFVANGYSGAPGYLDNPDDQQLKDKGPLPVGLYIIEPPIEKHPKLGLFVLPLNPSLSNQMYGRSGFYIHGDNALGNGSASEGCIIMPHDARVAIWASNDHVITVQTDDQPSK